MSGRRVAAAALLWTVASGCKHSAAATFGLPFDAGGYGSGLDAEAGAGNAAAAPVSEPPPSNSIVPPTTSDELTVRARHLLEAIANDNADLAVDILFPRDAWAALRDASDAGKDWDKHVAAPFRHAVHALSRHRPDLRAAQFVSLDLGRTIVQTLPHRKGWKEPLWTVHASRLTFVVDGHTNTLVLGELTAWRGAWYVTRLR